MNLYERVEVDNYVKSFQISLTSRTGTARFPKDHEVIEALKYKDMYNINSKNRLYFLERLENHNNQEFVKVEGNQNITIEHIFPQNPSNNWKLQLGDEDYEKLKDEYLNTISNLTLSGSNSQLGNKTFIEKRDLKNYGYADSRFWLNSYLGTLDKWTVYEVEQRFQIIAERFKEIWCYPNIDFQNKVSEEVNIFDADEPKGKKLSYAIFMNEKLKVTQVSKLYVEVMSRLFESHKSVFLTTELQTKINITKNPNDGTVRQPQAINDTYFIETNMDSNSKFNRLKLALNLLKLEDELYIKYDI